MLGAKAIDNTGLSATDEVTVTVAAPAGPAVVTSPAAVSVPEGSFADVGVKLSQAPSSNVTVTSWTCDGTSCTVPDSGSVTSRRHTASAAMSRAVAAGIGP